MSSFFNPNIPNYNNQNYEFNPQQNGLNQHGSYPGTSSTSIFQGDQSYTSGAYNPQGSSVFTPSPYSSTPNFGSSSSTTQKFSKQDQEQLAAQNLLTKEGKYNLAKILNDKFNIISENGESIEDSDIEKGLKNPDPEIRAACQALKQRPNILKDFNSHGDGKIYKDDMKNANMSDKGEIAQVVLDVIDKTPFKEKINLDELKAESDKIKDPELKSKLKSAIQLLEKDEKKLWKEFDIAKKGGSPDGEVSKGDLKKIIKDGQSSHESGSNPEPSSTTPPPSYQPYFG